jgi:phage tail-like protein
MPTFRDLPYSAFNYLVDLGNGDTASPQAGFSEVSGLSMEIKVADYRNGNWRENSPRKVSGSYTVPDVTLKRGVIGAEDHYGWLNNLRDGVHELRTVTIQLLAEDRSGPVLNWKLTNARPIKYTGPTLSGTSTEVAVEELVLACERIDMY